MLVVPAISIYGTTFADVEKEAASDDALPGVHWRTVNYDDQSDLEEALRGTHTVFSFVQLLSDPGGKTQKNLIDAAITAGVKRFAPSEHGR